MGTSREPAEMSHSHLIQLEMCVSKPLIRAMQLKFTKLILDLDFKSEIVHKLRERHQSDEDSFLPA